MTTSNPSAIYKSMLYILPKIVLNHAVPHTAARFGKLAQEKRSGLSRKCWKRAKLGNSLLHVQRQQFDFFLDNHFPIFLLTTLPVFYQGIRRKAFSEISMKFSYLLLFYSILFLPNADRIASHVLRTIRRSIIKLIFIVSEIN